MSSLFLLAEVECMMNYVSIVNLDYKFFLYEKATTTELFLYGNTSSSRIQDIDGMKISDANNLICV